jgi:hypothetical protein
VELWTEIAARELAMLVTLLALGIGPASFLGPRFDGAARLSIAAALGLCLSTCVFTTLIWFTAARHTYWLIPAMAIVSVAVALHRGTVGADSGGESRSRRVAPRWLPARDTLALAFVCLIVAAPLSYTLHERDSVGPTSFLIGDSAGYVEEADGAAYQSLSEAEHHEPRSSTPTLTAWTTFALSSQNLDAAPLAANLNEFMGVGSTETQSSFMIVFLIVGALGAFAAVRYFTARPTWAAPLAGALFAGPLFLQLLADGSQAAICGIALMPPIAAVGVEALRERRFANLVLLALLTAGLMALYPLYVPTAALAAGVVLLAWAIAMGLRGRLSAQAVCSAGGRVGVVLGLTIVFNFVSATRNLRFWTDTSAIYAAGRPIYKLPISVLPGWLLQTRQFFLLTDLAHASAHEVLIGAVLPAVFIVVILVGLWRWRSALVLLALILAFAALAEYAGATRGCSYCVDRNLLPVAPLIIVLFALGVAALASARRAWLRWAGIAVAVVAIVAVGDQTRTERVLFATDSYFLENANRALLAHLPASAGPVDLEGYGVSMREAVPELTDMYSLLSENGYRVSVPNEYPSYTQFKSLGTANYLNPSYRYVLTRFAGVQNGRRTIARIGPFALEERVGSLDVTLVSGALTTLSRWEPQGVAQISEPLHLLLIGGGSTPAWILLRFRTIAEEAALPQRGLRARSTRHTLTVCMRPAGTPPVRRATLGLEGPLFSGIVPPEPFAPAEPPQGIQLVVLRAVTHCSLTGPS